MIKKIPFILLLGCLLFFSCKKSTGTLEELTIYVPRTLSSIPMLELQDKKIAGVTIKVDFFQDHLITMAEFVNGQKPVLMTGFTQGMKNYQSSKDVVQVVCPVWGVSSLIVQNEQIKTIADLEGKKVLVPFAGSPLDLQLQAMLKKAGLEDKVIIDYAVFQQMIPMLLTNKTDGICVPEPLASKLVIGKGSKELFTFASEWGKVTGGEERSPQVSVFVKKGFAGKNKKFLSALVKELKSSTENTNKNRQEMASKYAPVFELPEKVVERGLGKMILDIPDSKTARLLCTGYLEKINSTDSLDDSFFFEY